MDNKKKEENIGFHITKPILPGIDVCNEKKKRKTLWIDRETAMGVQLLLLF